MVVEFKQEEVSEKDQYNLLASHLSSPIQNLMVVLTWSLKNNYSLKQVLTVRRWKELYKLKAVMK